MTLPELLIGIDINTFSANNYGKVFMRTIIIISSLITLYHLLFGRTVLELATQFENWATKKANELLSEAFLPDSHPDKQKRN